MTAIGVPEPADRGFGRARVLAGVIADASNLKTSILVICLTAWILCFFFYLGTLFFIEGDIQSLRDQMSERAEIEKAKQAA